MHIIKAILSAVTTLAALATSALADDVLGVDETGGLVAAAVVAAVGVWTVWRVPNAPAERHGRP